DWLESNNEYWLEHDARLRTDFNITTGFQTADIARAKYKSKMKKYYQKAHIPTARFQLATSLKACQAFAAEVGYPIIAKPDNGVGASHTCRIDDDGQLQAFYKGRRRDIRYILEEYIAGEVNSYDAIIDSHGEPIFETGNISPVSIMDIVNNEENSVYYILNKLPEDTRQAGRATVKSFDVKSRFVHFEFFRLDKRHKGLGKKGDLVALEVNMRPSGGFSPDMMNFAHSTDVYKIWADMVAYDRSTVTDGKDAYCAFAGLRDAKRYALSHEDIMAKYGNNIRMVERLPKALSGAMGNRMYLAVFDTEEEVQAFYKDVLMDPEQLQVQARPRRRRKKTAGN
ncbi:MAG TPA: carbamoylphosphate synthase large subunit, partial [Lachnospiraceae bacterium]|nr:carbamoylphosphate synthase large subunit [Lachnospiraceae bacterium]